MIDIRTALQIFNLIRRKSFWIILLLGVSGYFAYTKYGNQVMDKNPQLQDAKAKIEKIKNAVK